MKLLPLSSAMSKILPQNLFLYIMNLLRLLGR